MNKENLQQVICSYHLYYSLEKFFCCTPPVQNIYGTMKCFLGIGESMRAVHFGKTCQ